MLKESEILQFIQEDLASKRKQKAKEGQDYYEGQHDILRYELYYYDKDGALVKDTTRSNIKIPHPFYTEIVDQTVQYLLPTKERYIKSDKPELQKHLDDYFDEDFTSELQEALTGCVAKGFDYMYAYTNKDGKLAFQYADGLNVVEVEGKYTSTGKDYIIYWYKERINQEKKEIKRVQVWDNEKTWYYTQIDNELVLDDAEEGKPNPRPHVLYKKTNDDNTYYEGLGFIPFFRLDYNRKQTNNLQPIKALIDDYDLMACGLSNNLQDASEYVVVLRGFEGDNLAETVQNIKTLKRVGMPDTNADMEFKTVAIPYDARKVKLELDEKNIYRFGMAFNSAQIGDGNITNIVIKSRYALLDLKCNKLELKLRQFLRKIIGVVLERINKEDDAAYQEKNVYFEFEREIMTNAQDNAMIDKTKAEEEQIRITTLKDLATNLGDEKVLELICEVLDIDVDDVKAKAPVRENLQEFLQVDPLEENNE